VHDLQPLNAVSIKESSISPNLDQFVDQFLGGKCFTVFDLYWGFDARKMDEASRDMTAFQTPLGLLVKDGDCTLCGVTDTNCQSCLMCCMTDT